LFFFERLDCFTLFLGDGEHRLKIITLLHPVLTDQPTGETTMDESFPSIDSLIPHWFHESPTRFGSVTRMDIDMFPIKTSGAVVGITITRDRERAVFADKVFYFFLKNFHKNLVQYVCIIANKHYSSQKILLISPVSH
jgi:hypothetical protein